MNLVGMTVGRVGTTGGCGSRSVGARTMLHWGSSGCRMTVNNHHMIYLLSPTHRGRGGGGIMAMHVNFDRIGPTFRCITALNGRVRVTEVEQIIASVVLEPVRAACPAAVTVIIDHIAREVITCARLTSDMPAVIYLRVHQVMGLTMGGVMGVALLRRVIRRVGRLWSVIRRMCCLLYTSPSPRD